METQEGTSLQSEDTGGISFAETVPVDSINDAAPKKKRERKEQPAERQPGKTLFPISKVQKIIKADKDIPIIAKEATYLISVATEEFLKRISEAAMAIAERERRTTVQHKDIATVVRKADEFLFLEEILPWTFPEPPAKRKPPKAEQSGAGVKAPPTLLDQFVVRTGGEEEVNEDADIIMNDDGAMYVSGMQDVDQ